MVPPIKELRKLCRSNINKGIFKFLSIYITKILLYFNPTPNQITAGWIIIGIIGSFLFLFVNKLYAIIGISLLILTILLDYCDGDVARYRNIHSIKGLYLDFFGHSIVQLILFSCITYYVIKTTNNFYYAFFGISAIVGYSLMELSRLYKHELVPKKISAGEAEKLFLKKNPLSFKIHLYSRTILFEYFFFYILILLIFNRLEYFLIGYAIFYHPFWIFRYLYELKTGFKDKKEI